MHLWQRCKFLLLLLSARAHIVAGVAVTPTSSVDIAQPTQPACGTIVNDEDEFIFDASLVYECLISVPFNPAVATRLIEYYNDTLDFQSTVEFLKSPPPSYQQPSVDLRGGLQMIQDAVVSNSFANQYEFEVALQRLIMASHDTHLYLSAGILSAFSFGAPYDIVSLSIDGVEAPKVYLANDILDSNSFADFQPSAIKSINNQDAASYLDAFAANQSAGAVEPHTDWNQLMFSFAQDIQGTLNIFGWLAPFYFGDTMTLEFENGTRTTDPNVGIYWSQGPTGPLETGGDFYNFFVLGFYPASFDTATSDEVDDSDATTTDSAQESATATSSVPEATSSAPVVLTWNSTAYPQVPDVAQPDLGTYGGGFFSGYFLNSSSVSVLSIPSFDEFDAALNTAQQTVREFIERSKEAGLQKVVIDLQQNTGGQVLLAIATFKQFFPNIEPFAGSQMRASHPTDVMGRTLTQFFEQLPTDDELYPVYVIDEWVSSARLNAETGSNFTSWDEFFGPIPAGDDVVTRTQRFNLSSEIFIDNAAEGGIFDLNPTSSATSTPPWAPEDIIILTDGVCGSSCALFVEMMHHEAGVRVVTVGGRPVPGPMQGVGNTRGARSMSTFILDNNIDVTQDLLNDSPDAHFLPNRTEALDVYILGSSINLRDQVRKGNTTPLQFAYEPADCRIYFTPQTIFNYTALWQYAADAIWTKPALCIAGSTGILPTNSTVSQPQSFDIANHIPTNEIATPLADPDYSVDELAGDLQDGLGRNNIPFINCSPSRACPARLVCKAIRRFTSDNGDTFTCVPKCRGQGSPCPGGTCSITDTVESTRSNTRVGSASAGFCNLFPVDDQFVGANRTRALNRREW
ncbi:hypothetical protein HD806DRAFT_72048 [Xylariaceae sp. AK1471]|nr:hypothetical protein HD806DRAFT_72048 [Xylariaceae sp. AK1471]